MQQAVDAAQVHEGAEVGDVLDGARAQLSLVDVLEQDLLLGLALLLQQLAPRDDDVHALHIDFDDARAQRLVQEITDIGGPAQADLAGGQEDVDALHIDEQAALDLALDNTLDVIALVVLGGNRLPGAQAIGPALAQLGHILAVEALVVDLEDLALLGQFIAELADGDMALGLAADVHGHQAGALVHGIHRGLHDGSRAEIAHGFGEDLVVADFVDLAEGFLEPALQLLRIEF